MVVGVFVVPCCYFSQSHVSYSFRRVVSRASHTEAKDPPLRERAHAAIWDPGEGARHHLEEGMTFVQLSAQQQPHHINNTTERKDYSYSHSLWRILGSPWSHKNNTGTRTQLRSQHRKEQATGGIPLLPSTQLDFLRATFGDTSLLDGKPLSLLDRYHILPRLHKTNFNRESLKERPTPTSMAYHELGIIGKPKST